MRCLGLETAPSRAHILGPKGLTQRTPIAHKPHHRYQPRASGALSPCALRRSEYIQGHFWPGMIHIRGRHSAAFKRCAEIPRGLLQEDREQVFANPAGFCVLRVSVDFCDADNIVFRIFEILQRKGSDVPLSTRLNGNCKGQ